MHRGDAPLPPRDLPEEHVVLVDLEDRPRGTMEKLRAHREGRLHRAFSIFLFDGEGRLLLQRRAVTKYHSPGLWSNTCCGHPRPEETVQAAAARRLLEEMGLRSELREIFRFVYRAELDQGLVEHELDHVLAGAFTGAVAPDRAEVLEWRWTELPALIEEVARQPRAYTAWLQLLLANAGHRAALERASRVKRS